MGSGHSHHNKSIMNWCDLSHVNTTNQTDFCVLIQTYTISNSHVRVCDLFVLFFNVIFLLFLLLKLVPTIKKLRSSWTLFSILYCLIFIIPICNCIHEVLSMALGHTTLAPKITHFVLRGAILTAEISVVVFGLTFKFYHNQKCRLAVTMSGIVCFSIAFTITEALLDILDFHKPLACQSHDLFTHGGMIFLFSTSMLFAMAYLFTFCLYLLNLYKRWNLPSKKSFYRYALFLFCVNIVQSLGSMLWFFGYFHEKMGNVGICLILITTDIYFITFAPVVYWIFLRNYFRMAKPASPPKSNLNTSQDDNGSVNSQWWRRWTLKALKPSRPISVPIYKHGHLNESSSLIKKGTPSSVESSYGSSYSSAEFIP